MLFLREHQLDIMLFMSGICCILAFMTMAIKSLPQRMKNILALMEFSSMLLLLLERAAYLYSGNVSGSAYYIVRFCNGLVFFLTILVPHLVTHYLRFLYEREEDLQGTPFSLRLCTVLFYIGTILIIISQFTGLYYTIDDRNIYHRSPWFPLSYIVPFLLVLLQEGTIIRYRNRLKKSLVCSLVLSLALPTVVSIVQIFCYGLSLTSIATVSVVIVFYVYALLDMGSSLEASREQTALALAGAIDAKDNYTHGHSTRVAELSREIAKRAGYSGKESEKVYFSALLHDIGKIGIPDTIINKEGALTEEEFALIRQHPTLGHQILSSITQSPYLSIGAHYHHERYDGKGYPDGLAGKKIPEIARIIAVADAYDAMSSRRSYRDKLPPEKIRQELINGIGKQFDPRFAKILLKILDGS